MRPLDDLAEVRGGLGREPVVVGIAPGFDRLIDVLLQTDGEVIPKVRSRAAGQRVDPELGAVAGVGAVRGEEVVARFEREIETRDAGGQSRVDQGAVVLAEDRDVGFDVDLECGHLDRDGLEISEVSRDDGVWAFVADLVAQPTDFLGGEADGARVEVTEREIKHRRLNRTRLEPDSESIIIDRDRTQREQIAPGLRLCGRKIQLFTVVCEDLVIWTADGIQQAYVDDALAGQSSSERLVCGFTYIEPEEPDVLIAEDRINDRRAARTRVPHRAVHRERVILSGLEVGKAVAIERWCQAVPNGEVVGALRERDGEHGIDKLPRGARNDAAVVVE